MVPRRGAIPSRREEVTIMEPRGGAIRQVFFLFFPHTAAVTTGSLRSSLGRGGIGTPRGFVRYFSFPHTAAVTPESLRSSLGRGGIGLPRGLSGILPTPTQRRLHPSPSGPAWAAGG